MQRNVMLGLVAGAAGTEALNIVSYLDMAIRGRPASRVPAQLVDTVARELNIDLSAGSGDPAAVEARETAIGALLGYLNGLTLGVLYGALRPGMRDVSQPLAGATLGALAMAASDIPAVALGVTNPKEWGLAGWLADIVPHMAYGLVTTLVFETFRDENR